ncbi:MAG: bifunctional diaminohydroxyphosphoribosylaminopyrimidine deaminase/5-amino-6-(5-phosphoribosylamino)uracil reductase RibD [Crocinitomicaceae bacterium]
MKDEQYMQRCLQLAQLGTGSVAPNPLVGSVIVYENKIIGEGYHHAYGEAHAEVNAIASVKDQSLLSKSTIYINLEPCAHHGKTPPCADLIVEEEIPRVVIACVDVFSEVSGKGIEKLKKSGAEVKVGVLENDALDLNKRFFTFHTKKRPYVILKWAQSADGYMDINRSEGQKGGFWITQPSTQQLTHKWRHEEAGILVGNQTVITDDPELTVRAIKGNSPSRFVIDRTDTLELSHYKIGNDAAPTYKITQKGESFEIRDILDQIYERDIQSLIVEGGKKTLEKFIDSGCWDEARILTGSEKIHEGSKSPSIEGEEVSSFYFGQDHIQILKHA